MEKEKIILIKNRLNDFTNIKFPVSPESNDVQRSTIFADLALLETQLICLLQSLVGSYKFVDHEEKLFNVLRFDLKENLKKLDNNDEIALYFKQLLDIVELI